MVGMHISQSLSVALTVCVFNSFFYGMNAILYAKAFSGRF